MTTARNGREASSRSGTAAAADPVHALLRLVGNVVSPGGARAKLTVLVYHRVLPQPDDILYDEIDADTFERHAALLASAFNVLTLGAACARLARGSLPPRAVAVTFDDGYADNERIALPILQRYGLKATFFIAAGYLDGGIMFNDVLIDALRRARAGEHDLTGLGLGHHALGTSASRRASVDALIDLIKYRPVEERAVMVGRVRDALGVSAPASPMMTTAQLRRLHDAGMEIGAHTVRHPILAAVDDREAWSEIVGARRRLEAIVDAPVTLFAYPNGKAGRDYDARHVRMVKDAGYAAAVSTHAGVVHPGSDRYQLPRVGPWDRDPRRLGARLLLGCARVAGA